MNNEPPAHRPIDPDGEPAITPGLGPDDIVVGQDDLSIIVEVASPAGPASIAEAGEALAANGEAGVATPPPADVPLGGAEDLRAMSERLRRVEEELDGVFQTIGRLLRGGDVSDLEDRRLAADAARLEDIEKRLAQTLAVDRSKLSDALDEHFERIRRVLHEGAEPGSQPEAEKEPPGR